LVFRNLGDWILGRYRQLVRTFGAGPVIRYKAGVRSDRPNHRGAQGARPPAALDRRPLSILNPQQLRQQRVHLRQGLGVLVDQRTYPSCLRSREELADDPDCREDNRVLGVDYLGWWRIRSDVETGFTIRKIERPGPLGYRVPRPGLKQPRRSRVIFG